MTSRETHPRTALLVILGCQLMVILDATIVNIALPRIQADLGFSRADLSWIINAYALAFGGLLLLGARTGDILGRRTTFFVGVGLFTVASLVGGLAPEPATLLVARAAQGVGAAFAAPSALALLMTAFPEGTERTRALGYYTGVSIGASALGLLMGGLLVQWASWRWVMFVNVPIGILLLVLSHRALPETKRVPGQFDLPGAVTSTLGMTALVFGFVRVATDGWTDPLTLVAFAGGLLLLSLFIRVELRAATPVTPLRLFTNRDRNVSYVVRLLLVGGMQGMFFFITQFMQDVLGFSALATGLGFLPLTVVVFGASQAAARGLMVKLGAQRLILGGLCTSTSAMVVLTQLSSSSGYLAVLIPMLMFGLGNGLAFVPLTAAALQGVEPRDAGAASGLVNAVQQVGGSLGLSLLVTVFGTAARSSGHPPDSPEAYVSGANAAFVLAAVLLALAALLTAVNDHVRRPAPPAPAPVPQPENAAT